MMRRALTSAALVLGTLLQPSSSAAQGAAAATAPAADSFTATPTSPAPARSAAAALAPTAAGAGDAAAVYGVSGALKVATVPVNQPVASPFLEAIGRRPEAPRWVPVHGTVRGGLPGEPVTAGEVIAPEGPGIWRLDSDQEEYVGSAASLAFITTVPFSAKRGERLNGYHIGIYPTERSPRSDAYAPPEQFIEVTAENQDLQISEHFRLRHFLTKDQFDVWPKYLALNLRLVDKLELVLQELNAMGVRAMNLHVMSGFRTPQYNGPGGDGRATLSRHMYGDAADIWVDGDHDGYIDDLNGDGRQDIRDAEVLLRAVERVEQKYPELTGGAGLYESNEHHGPYVHVDVRGQRARW